MTVKRGALLVMEGVDCSGKSTQCKKLVDSLNQNKIRAQLMNFPDRTTKTGEIINSYLKDKNNTLCDQAIHLLFSANRWENVGKMEKLLKDGVTLVIDRYSYSGIVYSAVKKNMDINWCKQPEVGLPKPDIVFLLTLKGEDLADRPGFGNERYENVFFQNKVSELFTKLSEEDDNWKVIDASGNIEDVQEKIFSHVKNKMDKIVSTPLDYLTFN